MMCGTLDYLSPEMLNRKQYDAAIDRWMLGIMLYEFLYGKCLLFCLKYKVRSFRQLVCVVRIHMRLNFEVVFLLQQQQYDNNILFYNTWYFLYMQLYLYVVIYYKQSL
eukprot:TRINITY_DN33_c0_g1_i5.p5 TRINITY_DN33_c0_g1~~TRINITY_DN33_c0_g1_i5.p5  ORF type:complete len:108 (+),score=5.62 TRINITY_DN33_c0_g1_i5:309-632(+)